jgi:hypothetical protein
MVDLQALQAVVEEHAQQFFERGGSRAGNTGCANERCLRPRGCAAHLLPAPAPLVSTDAEAFAGQILVEGFLVGLHITFPQQHLGEMRMAAEALAEQPGD